MPSVGTVLHMNAGNGEFSYAKNSTFQETAILKSAKVLLDSVKDYGLMGFPECFKIADLGCSSGPNTLLFVSSIIDLVRATCQERNLTTPEIQAFLNDLPDNDFNTIFKMVPPFLSKLSDESGKCFILGVPGSFYARLFPTKSLHFVHSSSSLNWLSKVPEKLENSNRNVYVTRTSPPDVYEAYFNQFKKDFSTFLHVRSEEMVVNGRMVLTFYGRIIEDPFNNECCSYWEQLGNSLQDLFAEGLILEEDLNSFNLPIYCPSANELKAVIEHEGSFNLYKLETIEVNLGLREDDEIRESVLATGKTLAKTIRAAIEPMLAKHFGNCVMDKVFERYAVHLTEHLSVEKPKHCFHTVILHN